MARVNVGQMTRGISLRLFRWEPWIAIALCIHGAVVLLYLSAHVWQWGLLLCVGLLGLLGFVKWLRASSAILLRAILLVTLAAFLIASTGGADSQFRLCY